MGLNNNNSIEKSGAKARRSIYNLVLIVVVGVLFVTGYTYILQKMYNDSILDNCYLTSRIRIFDTQNTKSE